MLKVRSTRISENELDVVNMLSYVRLYQMEISIAGYFLPSKVGI